MNWLWLHRRLDRLARRIDRIAMWAWRKGFRPPPIPPDRIIPMAPLSEWSRIPLDKPSADGLNSVRYWLPDDLTSPYRATPYYQVESTDIPGLERSPDPVEERKHTLIVRHPDNPPLSFLTPTAKNTKPMPSLCTCTAGRTESSSPMATYALQRITDPTCPIHGERPCPPSK